jgi:hypothetical protein
MELSTGAQSIIAKLFTIYTRNYFSLKSVLIFKYLEMTVRNENYNNKEVMSKLNLGVLAVIQFRIFCLPVCYLKM